MLLAADQITKKYGDKVLFEDVSFYLQEGDKVGIIGVNGTGKSTLLNILAKKDVPDSGKVTTNSGIKVECLAQNPQWDEDLTILEHVFSGASAGLKNTKEYEAKSILNKLGLSDFNRPIGVLSGGQKKRVAMATALVHPCDVLILDEPTNHLDNEMVMWLENYLIKFTGAIIMVTHDRYFLDRVTQKIVEIDQGKLYSYQGNYSQFLQLKAQREDMEQATNRKNKSLLRKELEWMQQGAKARGTKSKERIMRFEELKDKTASTTSAKLEVASLSSRLGKKIIEIDHISKKFADQVLVDDFSYFIGREARIGIVGSNGCGKSTLLNMISGTLLPDSGSVIRGETVKLGYFTQDCSDMDLSLRVIDFIRNIAETIETPDGSYSASQMLERFLFSPTLQWNTISRLSGGERRRLYLLSILMDSPNVLFLDEPTNDLDIETLTILEDYLENFKGPVIAVSHDRYFLDKVVDMIFSFEGNGIIQQYTGNYSDFLDKKPSVPEVFSGTEAKVTAPRTNQRNKKLAFTYKEQQEYAVIDREIADLEEQLQQTEILIQGASSDYVKLQEHMDTKKTLEESLEAKTERWLYLQDLADQIEAEKMTQTD